ncbi:MAG TPA: hypothetical protein VGE07_23640 [Herpetosiphonaceae bacterium]
MGTTEVAHLVAVVEADVAAAQRDLKATDQTFKQMGEAAERSAAQVEQATGKLSFQQRELGILKQELTDLRKNYDESSTAVQRKMLQIEKLESSIASAATKTNELAKAEDQATKATNELSAAEAKASAGLNKFGGQAGVSIKNLAMELGAAALAMKTFDTIQQAAIDGYKLSAELDQNHRALNTFMQSVERGNAVYKEAIQFGEKYGYTQKVMAESAKEAAPLFKQTHESVSKTLEVLGRLASLNTKEGFSGATLATKELSSGDTTSIVERFNLSRQAMNALKEEIASGGDVIALLDAEMNKMGVTSEVLANRLEGPNEGLVRMEMAEEKAQLALGNFLINVVDAPALLTGLADGLEKAAIGFESLQKNSEAVTINQMVLEAGGTYEDYARAADTAAMSNAGWTASATAAITQLGPLSAALIPLGHATGLLGQETTKLSEAQWNAMNAMLAQGVSMSDATARAQELATVEEALSGAFERTGSGAALSAQSRAELTARSMELAAQTPGLREEIEGLATEFESGIMTADDYAASLEYLANAHVINEAEANKLNGATMLVAATTVGATVAVDQHSAALWQLGDAQFADIEAKIQQQIEAARLEQFNYDLEQAALAAGDGFVAQTFAALQLANAYGRDVDEINVLIKATNELKKSQAGGVGQAVARAVVRNVATEVRQIEREAERLAKPKRGGGRAGGQSAEQKAAKAAVKDREQLARDLAKTDDKIREAREKLHDKLAEAEEKHLDKVSDIWADYYAKALAAEKKFNSDKFDTQLAFYDSLAAADEAQRAAAIAAEQQAWAEAQAIAQAGNAKLAEEYYNLRLEQIKADQERADSIRELEQKITEETDAEQRKRLEQQLNYEKELDARHDQRDKERLEQLQQNGDELAQDRDKRLADENESYEDARNELIEDYKKGVDDILSAQQAQVEAHKGYAAQIISSYDEMRRAAAAGIPSAGGPAGSEAPADGSHAWGKDYIPHDGYRAILHKGERVKTAWEARQEDRRNQQAAAGQVASPQSAGGDLPPIVNNFYGPADPKQVEQAQKNGVLAAWRARGGK